MTTNDRKDIQIHGKIYKRFIPPNGEKYDGLNLPEEDCKKLVKRFYEEKKKKPDQKRFVNVHHGSDFLDYVGDISDIYYDSEQEKLGAFLRINKKSKSYDKVLGLLGKENPPGLSFELGFDYENVGDGFVQTPETKVSEKYLLGVSLVDVPDHHKDDTFVNSWVISDDPSDLFMVHDKTFEKFLSDVEESTKYADNIEDYKKYSKKVFKQTKQPLKSETKSKDEEKQAEQQSNNDVSKISVENEEQKAKTNVPDTQINNLNNSSISSDKDKSIVETKDLGTKNQDKMSSSQPAPNLQDDKKDSQIDKPDQTKEGKFYLDKKELDDMISSAVRDYVKTARPKPSSQKNSQTKSQVKKEVKTEEPQEPEGMDEEKEHVDSESKNDQHQDETLGQDLSTDENNFDQNGEMGAEENDEEYVETNQQPKSQQRKRTQSKDSNRPDEGTSQQQKRRKNEMGMSYDSTDNGHKSIMSALKSRTDTLEEIGRIKNDPRASKKYFADKEREQTEDMVKLVESLKDYFGGDDIPRGVGEAIDKSFADGTYKDNQLVQVGLAGLLERKTTAGLRTHQSSLSHREAEIAYQESKRKDGMLNPRNSSLSHSRNQSNGNGYSGYKPSVSFAQNTKQKDANSFDSLFSRFVNQERRDQNNQDDMDVDTDDYSQSRQQDYRQTNSRATNRMKKSSPGMGIPAQPRKSLPLTAEQLAKIERDKIDNFLYKEFANNPNPVATISISDNDVESISSLTRRDELSKGFSSLSGQRDYVKEITAESETFEELKRNVNRGVLTDEGRAGPLSKVVFDVYTENLIRNNEPGRMDAMHKYGGLSSIGTTVFSY